MKRQLRNYLIYFITIAITISLVFAMNNMIYNDDLQQRAEKFASLSVGLIGLSTFLCIIIAIVLGYANAFMLRLRQREFGTYLTLGMKRHQIVKLFLLENSFLGLFAIFTGFLFGSLLYQALMILMSNLLQYEFSFSFVSLKGVIVTLIMAIAIFVVTFISSSVYLSRVTIFELIHGEKKVNKVEKTPVISVIFLGISAFVIVFAFMRFGYYIEAVFKDSNESGFGMLYMILLLAVSIIIFHITLARSLMFVLLRMKNWTQKGTNQFLFRQLSAALSSNALLLGLLAFLMTFAVIAANTGFLYKAVEEENIERSYPFDVLGNEDMQSTPAVAISQALKEIEKVSEVERFIETPFYTTGNVNFLQKTDWYDESYTDKDVYMRESDLNELLIAIGEQPIQLNNQFAIYADMPMIKSYDFSKEIVDYQGKQYTYSHTEDILPAFVWAYFVIVVPDVVVEEMTVVQKAYAVDMKNKDFDANALQKALTYTEARENYFIERSDYRIKEFQRIESMSFSAILIVGTLYVGFVFLLLAMAILALKTLSTIQDDMSRYTILNRIGVTHDVQSRTLAKQIFVFFAFPIVVPILLAIPTALISNRFITLLGFSDELGMGMLATMIIIVIMLIYFIYFVVTLSIQKRHVLK